MFSNNPEGPQDRPPAPAAGRRRGRPRGATAQAEATRDRLYRTTIERFASRGYEATTLRDIAARAGASPGLLYRYFPSKRAVVLALYDRLSLDFVAQAGELPGGAWRDRFARALDASLGVLRPHRGTLVALVPVLVAGPDEGLFAPATAFSRARVAGVFAGAVTGARDAPRGEDGERLGRLLDLLHLCVILFWLLDRSRDQRATAGLVAVIRRALPPFALALRLRVVRALLRDLDELVRQGFHGDGPPPAPTSASA